MILDVLENAHRYMALHKEFVQAFKFLGRPDLKELPVATYKKLIHRAGVTKAYSHKNRI